MSSLKNRLNWKGVKKNLVLRDTRLRKRRLTPEEDALGGNALTSPTQANTLASPQ